MLAAAQRGQELRALQPVLAQPDGTGRRQQRAIDQLQPIREPGQESGALQQTNPGHSDRRSAKDLADGNSAGRSAGEHARSARLSSDAAATAAGATADEPNEPTAPNAAPLPHTTAFEPDANPIADVQPPVADRESSIADQSIDGPVTDDEPADDDGSAARADEPDGQPDEQPNGRPNERPADGRSDAGAATGDDAADAYAADEQPDE